MSATVANLSAKAEADRHKAACNTIAAFSSNPEIKTLAAAVSDANKWIDANFSDLQNILRRLSTVESELSEARKEIERLKSR